MCYYILLCSTAVHPLCACTGESQIAHLSFSSFLTFFKIRSFVAILDSAAWPASVFLRSPREVIRRFLSHPIFAENSLAFQQNS